MRAERAFAIDPERELGLALLDQRVMAGIGNVYKAEICLLLSASPWTPMSAVDPARVVALARRLLLTNTTRQRRFVRSTTGDTAPARRTWIYARGRAGCLRCGGEARVADQGEGVHVRPTWYCPRCQPGPHPG